MLISRDFVTTSKEVMEIVLKNLNREDFKKFMEERGVDVEFDSSTPGVFDGDNNFICSIDELFPKNLNELLTPPFYEMENE